MFFARKPFVRSTTLLAASAASFILLSSGSAQERDSRLELAAAVGQQPPSPVLNPRHPETYVVQRGDTLWDIASMFLRDPWYWPEIWQINPQVENPHLIFPGDILSLAYLDDGRPVVQARARPAGRARRQRIRAAVAARSLATARGSDRDDSVRDDRVVLVAAARHREGRDRRSAVHRRAPRRADRQRGPRRLRSRRRRGARGLRVQRRRARRGARRSRHNDVLGYQGIYVGQGRLDRTGDPGTLRMLETEREAIVGNYLMGRGRRQHR